jgi:hypothetical protein
MCVFYIYILIYMSDDNPNMHQYGCNFCNMTFKRQTDATFHSYTHANDTTKKRSKGPPQHSRHCPYCNKGFFTFNSLANHYPYCKKNPDRAGACTIF